MRALKNGLPMVIVPGLGGDQPINAAAVEDWKIGRSLPGDATVEMMRAAITEVLESGSYQEQAAAISTQLGAVDGASNGADEIKQVMANYFGQAS